MKVKKVNANAKKTEEKIKNSFIKLLGQKKEINQITVTDLVKDADLTRSAFYTHYDNIYDVAKAIQNDAVTKFIANNKEFNSFEDICNYIDSTIVLLKKNEKMLRMIVSSYEAIYYFDTLRNAFVNRMYNLITKKCPDNSNLKLDVEFFMDGMLFQIIKYYRKPVSEYSLDTIGEKVKIWLKELFLQIK